MTKVMLSCCAIFLLAISGCGKKLSETQTLRTAQWLSKCPDFSVTGKSPVVENAECGGFDVLENPQDAASAKIHLNVLRVPSINPIPQADPLFIIAGGPGQSAVNVASFVTPLFSDIRKNRDLIFVDQRGTGKSGPLECESSDKIEQTLSATERDQLIEKEIHACIEKYGDHLRYYATPFAVKDLDAVREQLGYPQINLWGASYGTRVVLEYMREFPAQTRAAVLDGVAPTDIALPWNMDTDSRAALQSINQQCANDQKCLNYFGNISTKAEQIAKQLQQAPISIDINHPRTHNKVHAIINGEDFSGLVRFMLYDRDMSTLIPQIISDTAKGDYQLLGSLFFLAKAKTDLFGINQTMHLAVTCSEDFPQYQNKLNTDNKPAENQAFLNSRSIQNYAKSCAQFPKAELSKDFWEYKKNETPTLILSGAQDPVTPPRWAELVQSQLPQSLSVIAPGGHHGISAQGCSAQLIALFIERGTAQGLETKCIQNIQPLAAHLPAQAEASSLSNNSASSAASKE